MLQMMTQWVSIPRGSVGIPTNSRITRRLRTTIRNPIAALELLEQFHDLWGVRCTSSCLSKTTPFRTIHPYYLSVCIYLSLSICLSVSVSPCPSLCLPISLCISACLSVCMSVCLSASVDSIDSFEWEPKAYFCAKAYPAFCLSVCVCVCVSLSLSLSLSLSQ